MYNLKRRLYNQTNEQKNLRQSISMAVLISGNLPVPRDQDNPLDPLDRGESGQSESVAILCVESSTSTTSLIGTNVFRSTMLGR